MVEIAPEIARPIPLREQVWLVMGLRWRLFRNGSRGRMQGVRLLGAVAAVLVWAAFGLGGGIGFGVGSYFSAQSGEFGYFVAMFWGVFAFWHVFPILSAQLAPIFDSSALLRFPLRFPAFVTLHLAYGFADPAAIYGMFWHFCIWLGIALARPDLAWRAALVLALSLAMNLVFGRMLYAWLERLLAQRRTREVLFAVFILVMLGFQFSGMIAQRWEKSVSGFLRHTASIWESLPPGEAGAAIQWLGGGFSGKTLLACAWLLVYTAAFGALLVYRLRAEYRGETFSETAAPASRRAVAAASAAGRIAAGPSSAEEPTVAPSAAASGVAGGLERVAAPGRLDGPVAAIFFKEVRYLYRNSVALMSLFVPLIIVGAFSVNARAGSHGRPGPFGRLVGTGFAYPAAVAYSVLILMKFCMNSLAYEGGGVQFLFLAPVKFRQVMLGKNLFQAAVLAVEALLALILIVLVAGMPPMAIILSTWTGLAFVTLANMAAGNWLSLRFPVKFEFGMRNSQGSGTSMLISFLVYFGSLALVGLVALPAGFLAGPWAVPAAFALLSLGAFFVYLTMLNATTQEADARRETLIAQIAR